MLAIRLTTVLPRAEGDLGLQTDEGEHRSIPFRLLVPARSSGDEQQCRNTGVPVRRQRAFASSSAKLERARVLPLASPASRAPRASTVGFTESQRLASLSPWRLSLAGHLALPGPARLLGPSARARVAQRRRARPATRFAILEGGRSSPRGPQPEPNSVVDMASRRAAGALEIRKARDHAAGDDGEDTANELAGLAWVAAEFEAAAGAASAR